MRNKLGFYIPVLYFLSTRISSRSKAISWVLIYIVPTFYIQHYLSECSFSSSLAFFSIQLLLIYNSYELGYIQNDAETIKYEDKPTMRLDSAALGYYARNKTTIYIVRVLSSIVLVLSLSIFKITKIEVFGFSLSLLLINVIFLIYNSVRSRWTLFYHFFLVTLRFLSFPVLFLGMSFVLSKEFFILIFLFPVPNLMERGGTARFNVKLLGAIKQSELNLASFRVAYYISLSLIILCVCHFYNEYHWILYLSCYYLLYRCFVVILILHKAKKLK